MSHKILIFIIFIAFLWGSASFAQVSARDESAPPASLAYADIADLVTGSPLVIKARIEKRKKINLTQADGDRSLVPHVLLTARVDNLIRGDNGVAPGLTFLVRDVPKGSPRPDYLRKKVMVMLFARPGGKAGMIQLTSLNAIQPWSAELEAATRALTAELVSGDSPPAITGIGDAFHTAGTVAGESETQIFLKTASGDPVSLSILRRPGQTPRWGVSLGEIVDESAAPPAPNTLLWYRLACGLPPRLPPESTRSLPVTDAEAARKDYRLVLESLGSCGRTL